MKLKKMRKKRKTLKELVFNMIKGRKIRITAKTITSCVNSNRKRTFKVNSVKHLCLKLVKEGKIRQFNENGYIYYQII